MNREKFGFAIVKDKTGQDVYARSENQFQLTKLIDANQIIFVNGPAGSGKTYLAVAKAVQYLQSAKVSQIILTRPAVESGENLGFLPGELDEKLAPYMAPLYDYLSNFFPKTRKKVNGDYPSKYKKKKEKQSEEKKEELVVNYNEFVKVVPLAFMRGCTFNNSFIIVDESQNITNKQMLMVLTRLGQNSKLVITGDNSQQDLDRRVKSGLIDAMNRLHHIKTIGAMEFDKSDVMRNDIIQEILEAYQE